MFTGLEGCERVEESNGESEAKEIMQQAISVAEEKDWYKPDIIVQNDLPYLMKYESSGNLVWMTDFWYQQKVENSMYKIIFATVHIEDKSKKVIFADEIKPVFKLLSHSQ